MKEFTINACGEAIVEAPSSEEAWDKAPDSGEWDIDDVSQIEEIGDGEWSIQVWMSCCVEAETDADAWENSPDAGDLDLDGVEIEEE